MSSYRILVMPELIAGWVVTGAEISVRCVKGLPEGARLSSVKWDQGTHAWELAFWVADGQAEHHNVTPEYERLVPVPPERSPDSPEGPPQEAGT